MLSRSPARRRRSSSPWAGRQRVVGRRGVRACSSGGAVSASPRRPRPRAVGQLRDRRARPDRNRFAHHPRDVGGRPARQAVGQPPGQQLVQQHAQRVDVGRRGHRLAAHLLGAGVLGRHQLEPRGRRRQRVPASSGLSSLAMPKSSSLGVPSAVTRTLAGLMSRWTIRFWCAYWTAAQTCRNSCSRAVVSRRLGVAVLDDRLALDVLHREVRAGRPASCRRRAGRRCSGARGRRGSGARAGSGGRWPRCPCRA